MELEGKTVLITGASAGIGAATAATMAAKGAHVLLAARTNSALQAVARQIAEAGGKASPYPVDVSDPEAVGRAAEAITSGFGTPDVIVNSAGSGRFLFIDETRAPPPSPCSF